MPKVARELSATEVRRLKKPGMHAVGGVNGLYLNVKPSGARSWIQRLKVGGKLRELGLGSFPTVTLEQARERAREHRQQVWDGIDPIAARRAAQDALRAAEARRITFDQAATACWRSKSIEFRNPKHAQQWKSTLDLYASPVIGSLPVDQVELAHIVSILRPIWETKTETASRLRGRMETVLEWARVSNYRSGENPAKWETLKHVLPKPSKVKKVRHHAALPWQALPGFMTKLRGRKGIAARALEFLIPTWARSGEVRLATWDEIDLKAKLWTIPGARMKAGKQHRVPLSEPAVKLLKALPRHEESPYVFWAPRGGPLSDMALSAVTRRMEVAAVPHGFRSSAKDWARNSTSYADEVSELQLAHVSSDATRAAYARDELLAKRQRLVRDWAKFCSSETSAAKASVTPIRGERAEQ